ncbi:hypothetical protein AcV7_008268 [Taiwanofungus camphoratus]|nr:hypothetical protein AcV7_008268 [Antrodia cinnamomea]
MNEEINQTMRMHPAYHKTASHSLIQGIWLTTRVHLASPVQCMLDRHTFSKLREGHCATMNRHSAADLDLQSKVPKSHVYPGQDILPVLGIWRPFKRIDSCLTRHRHIQ